MFFVATDTETSGDLKCLLQQSRAEVWRPDLCPTLVGSYLQLILLTYRVPLGVWNQLDVVSKSLKVEKDLNFIWQKSRPQLSYRLALTILVYQTGHQNQVRFHNRKGKWDLSSCPSPSEYFHANNLLRLSAEEKLMKKLKILSLDRDSLTPLLSGAYCHLKWK